MSIYRIGTGANAALMLAQIQKAEVALDTSNRQVATGKLADTYSGYGSKIATLESARSASARADGNVAIARHAAIQLDLQDAQLTRLADLAGELRQVLTKATADQDATALMSQMRGLFDQSLEILNAKDSNGYTYAGDNNQTPPVTVATLEELAALPSVAQAFANGSIKNSVRVGDTQTVEVGLLASDLGTDLMSLFQQIAQFELGASGPFGTKTTLPQQAFLESTIQTAIDTATAANEENATNGIRHRMVEDLLTRLEATSTVYKGFMSSIEDVDVAEALSRLTLNQVALQASFQVTSTFGRISILDFLR